MLDHVVRAAFSVSPTQLIVVLSDAKGAVAGSLPQRCEVAWQNEPLGTGHAVAQALPLLGPSIRRVAILYGDHPLLTSDAVNDLITTSADTDALVTLLTAILPDPGAYGRLVYDGDRVTGVVEAKDDGRIHSGPVEINSGISCYRRSWLEESLPAIPRSVVGEYYLTSLVGLAAEDDTVERQVVSVVASPEVAYGVNDRVELAVAERLMRRRINEHWMRSGVTIVDPESTFVDDTVEIDQDARLEPFSVIAGESHIGSGSTIGPYSNVRDSRIGNSCVILASTIENSIVGHRVHVGPYSHFRAGTRIDSEAHIGNYVETKNSTIGSGTHVGHFSYVGDATVGRNVNVAAGTITANYDGVNKHHTIIEDGAFIGCDTILRAPVTVGESGRTGAGSVVTRDVAPGTTVVGLPARPMKSKRKPDDSSGK